jgi:hypothetical protein
MMLGYGGKMFAATNSSVNKPRDNETVKGRRKPDNKDSKKLTGSWLKMRPKAARGAETWNVVFKRL